MPTSKPKQPLNIHLKEPVKGKQSIGISPGGAMDEFSYRTALALLNGLNNYGLSQKNSDINSFEIVLPDAITCKEDLLLVMTGAPRPLFLDNKQVEHATVHLVKKGQYIHWGQASSGFRSYLLVRPTRREHTDLVGRNRGPFKHLSAGWQTPGEIRTVYGPEAYLNREIQTQADKLLSTPYKISSKSNRMGIRLTPIVNINIGTNDFSMISQPTHDGTIQVTNEELIVLTRDRQTIGGYPRYLTLIQADLDLIAQYKPNEIVRIKLVSLDQAIEIGNSKNRSFLEWLNRLNS